MAVIPQRAVLTEVFNSDGGFVKHLILHEAIERNTFKDILFDYDIYGIKPGSGAAPVSMKERTDTHAVSRVRCFSEPCCPGGRGKMPEEP